MEFDELLGVEVGFCGVENNVVCLSVGGERFAFEAVRMGASVGYRSMMEEVREVPLVGKIFFQEPIALVKVERFSKKLEEHHDAESEGYELKDLEGKTWLRIGTRYADGYYPTFIFEYSPPGR